MSEAKFLSINVCSRHGVYSISVDGDNGGTRVTPSKCCGSWSTVKEWKLSERNWLDLASEATKAAAIAKGESQ